MGLCNRQTASLSPPASGSALAGGTAICFPTDAASAAFFAHSRTMHTSTVLVVEDDTFLRNALSQILTLRGYTVLQAAHGKEGMLLAQEHLPDLVLTDLSMPVLDGWGMIALLRSDPLTSTTPVIAMSAHPEAEAAQGFDVVLPKPTGLETLLSEIERLLDREPS